MTEHYISTFSVRNLWGHKNYDIPFHDDVNVIIGPNASGKTTLINILYDSLSGNLPRLSRINFEIVTIDLNSFDGKTSQKVKIERFDQKMDIHINKRKYTIPLAPFVQFTDEFEDPDERRFFLDRKHQITQFQHRIRKLAPAVWLPVSRRLPVSEEEEIRQRRRPSRQLESVDERLSDLTQDLQKYRLSLNAELSELRREFQLHALENILYDKRYDRELPNFRSFTPPSEDDEKSLLKAFKDVGLTDQNLEKRIREHFAAATDAYSKLELDTIDLGDVLIIPLINRTRSIINFAQELETKRGDLFSSLEAFENIVNSFLNEKKIKVSDQGELVIRPERSGSELIDWRHLSAGEKQILILLTQALLSEKNPVVYVADEPELSLHVEWQEKLLDALTRLAGRCQLIVATHSPDIVSGFGSKVIDLSIDQS